MQADYSKAALFQFIGTAQRQGLMNGNTAAGLRSAAVKLLEDTGDREDLRNLDVEAATIRFHNKNPGALTPSSLHTYQKRIKRLIRNFVEYTDNPTTYKPRGRMNALGERPARLPAPKVAGKAGKRTRGVARDKDAPSDEASVPSPSAAATSTSHAMNYPLRKNFVAQVVLPRDMTSVEARKLCAFIRTLAVDFSPKD